MSDVRRNARCARCKKAISVEGRPPRGATCPHCGAYLHSCVNCAFYCPGRHNDCREPQADYVNDKRAANFCDYFRFGEAVSDVTGSETPGARSPGGGKQAVRDRFDKLFGN
jgi:hypothetical protein